MRVPCHNCQKRELHCHSSCDAYIAYKDARAEQMQRLAQENKIEEIIIDSKLRILRRCQKKERK